MAVSDWAADPRSVMIGACHLDRVRAEDRGGWHGSDKPQDICCSACTWFDQSQQAVHPWK